MNIDDIVQQRIAAAKAQAEQRRAERAEFAERRRRGLQARHANKMRRQGRRLGFCATCARPLMRGTYLLCSKGCGGRLCRGTGRCAERHNPQCPNRATAYTDSPGEAA